MLRMCGGRLPPVCRRIHELHYMTDGLLWPVPSIIHIIRVALFWDDRYPAVISFIHET